VLRQAVEEHRVAQLQQLADVELDPRPVFGGLGGL
jgi:hypothetical protein